MMIGVKNLLRATTGAALLSALICGLCGAAEPVTAKAEAEALQREVVQLREQLEDTKLLLKQASADVGAMRDQLQKQNKTYDAKEWAATREKLERSQQALTREQMKLEQDRVSLRNAVRSESQKSEAAAAVPASQQTPQPAAAAPTAVAPANTGPLFNYRPRYSVESGYYTEPYGYGAYAPYSYGYPYGGYSYGYPYYSGPVVLFPHITSRDVDISHHGGTTLFNSGSSHP